MSKLLLLVHGMGKHEANWGDSVKAKLDQVAQRYKPFKAGKPAFTQRVKVVPLRYDQIFGDLVDKWQFDAQALDSFLKESPVGTNGSPTGFSRVLSWLRKPLPPEELNFFWTTAIDPLLYRGSALVRDQVRAFMADAIIKACNAMPADERVEVSIVAHSLGTAIVHDTLHFLGNQLLKDKDGNVLEAAHVSRDGFAWLFMLADVCMLGPRWVRDIDYFESLVRPISSGLASTSYCQFFVNTWHRWDPFVLGGPFRPSTWGEDYIPIGPLDHVQSLNVHAFSHYLDHPDVHSTIINAVLGDVVIVCNIDVGNVGGDHHRGRREARTFGKSALGQHRAGE